MLPSRVCDAYEEDVDGVRLKVHPLRRDAIDRFLISAIETKLSQRVSWIPSKISN